MVPGTLWVLISEWDGFGAHVYQCILLLTQLRPVWKYQLPVTDDGGGEQPNTAKAIR